MRSITTSLLALSLLACTQSPTPEIDVAAMHERVLTLDTHVDVPLTYMTEIDPGSETQLQSDLVKMRSGGLNAAFFIVYTPQGDLTDAGYAQALQVAETRIKGIKMMAEAYKDRVAFAVTAAEVRKGYADGKLIALVGMENAYPLGEACIQEKPQDNTTSEPVAATEKCHDTLKVWADRGVRYVGITHFGHNQFGDSSNPNLARDNGPRHNGLSDDGRRLVMALNDHGIMVDVSHTGKETMMQAADLSRAPIIASHSGVTAVAESARNLDDEQLRKIAEVGGVAQMVALDNYVKPYTQEQLDFRNNLRKDMGLETSEARGKMTNEQRAEYGRRIQGMWDMASRASAADFVDHIDHAVAVAGIDHVGIASDFDGGGGLENWENASKTANVTAELVRRGYSEEDIAKIWGGNLLRVMEATEQQAR